MKVIRKNFCLLLLIICISTILCSCELDFNKKPVVNLDLSNVNTEIVYGEELDLSNLKVSIKVGKEIIELTQGSETESNTYQIDYGNFDKNVLGTYLIKITSKNCIASSFRVNVVDSLNEIKLVGTYRTDYILNETLDFGDAYLSATYVSGNVVQVPLTNNLVSIGDFDSSTSGVKNINLVYLGKNCSIDVNVHNVQLVDVQLVSPDKLEYIVDEEIDFTGGKLLLTYSDIPASCPADIVPTELLLNNGKITINGFDTSTVGEKEVSVIYFSFENNFIISVNYAINQNEYILSFTINNQQVNLIDTKYIEVQNETDKYIVKVKADSNYIILFNGEEIEGIYDVVGSNCVVTYEKEIDYKYYIENGYELKLFVYNRQNYNNKNEESVLLYSKKIGFYRYSYITELRVNDIEFVRVDNNTYSPINNEYVPSKQYLSVEADLSHEDYIVRYKKASSSTITASALARYNKLIIDVYEYIEYEEDYYEELIQSFYLNFECDPLIYNELVNSVVISGATYEGVTTFTNKKLYTDVICVPNNTEKIYIDLGQYKNVYTITMYRGGDFINYVSGTDLNWYYIGDKQSFFQMRLQSSDSSYSISFVVIRDGNHEYFADEYISSVKLVGVEAEYVFIENKYLFFIPFGYSVDNDKISVVFEDAYANYKISITNQYSSRKILKIYDESNNLKYTCYIDLITFNKGTNNTEFLTLYTNIEDNEIEIMTLEFDNNKSLTISNCVEGSAIQFTMIGNYKIFTVSSNCLGLTDKTDNNFIGFIVDSNATQCYITINVKSTNGRTDTYTINITF